MDTTTQDESGLMTTIDVPVAQLEEHCRRGERTSLHEILLQDKDQRIEWQRLMSIAYQNNHIDLVMDIAAGSIASLQEPLENACKTGNVKFLQCCFSLDDKSVCYGVDWTRLIDIAAEHHHEDW